MPFVVDHSPWHVQTTIPAEPRANCKIHVFMIDAKALVEKADVLQDLSLRH
jgi:hypothetical protein